MVNEITFDIEELGSDIAEWFYDYTVVESMEVWEKIEDIVVDFKGVLFDEAEKNMKNKGITIVDSFEEAL